MKVTYMTEMCFDTTNEYQIIGYNETLTDSKTLAKNTYNYYGHGITIKITKLVGQNFGEGYHSIIWTTVDGLKYKRTIR